MSPEDYSTLLSNIDAHAEEDYRPGPPGPLSRRLAEARGESAPERLTVEDRLDRIEAAVGRIDQRLSDAVGVIEQAAAALPALLGGGGLGGMLGSLLGRRQAVPDDGWDDDDPEDY